MSKVADQGCLEIKGRQVFIQGTNVPVRELFAYLEDPDHDTDGFFASFPQATDEQARYGDRLWRIEHDHFQVCGLAILEASIQVSSKCRRTTWRLSMLFVVRWLSYALVVSAFPLAVTGHVGGGGSI